MSGLGDLAEKYRQMTVNLLGTDQNNAREKRRARATWNMVMLKCADDIVALTESYVKGTLKPQVFRERVMPKIDNLRDIEKAIASKNWEEEK